MMKILVVEDDLSQRVMLSKLVKGQLGYDVVEASNGKEALFLLKQDVDEAIILVLMDLNMPVMDGREALRHMRELYPHLAVIMITASEELKDAIEVMQLGANDFITKPYETERLKISIENVLRITELSEEVSRLHRKKEGNVHFHDLIGANTGLRSVVELAEKASQSDIPAYISGESGVGKELLARAIHGSSERHGKPFIAINCGAIPENLVESTLFGHKKGAFTGAISDQKGKFLAANGGTLFLDEVGDLPQEAQVKLLRVLQQKEIEPVGENKTIPVDVRIISATNRDVQTAISNGTFREDLFYRLNVFPLEMPALRQRSQDIPHLIDYFLKRFCVVENKAIKHITSGTYQYLKQYHWPGNVRELENAVFRAVVVSDEVELTVDDFSYMFSGGLQQELKKNDEQLAQGSQNDEQRELSQGIAQGSSVNMLRKNGTAKTMEELEWEVILHAIERNGGDIAKASVELEMGKSTLYRKVAEHKI